MALSSGTRLGPYEVLAPLGAGGMGEVYRARDTRLEREVAVKILPEGFASDPQRLRRFEQEARLVGALNHPNICAIFDVGAQDGTHYLVTELLEGQTLRVRLLESAVPLRKAIEYGVQIAQGLAAAHEKGIVHRDLKPENLFVTRDGRMKIFDFGLAKVSPAGAEASSDAPTFIATEGAGTQAGVVLGTAGYMSPEQVRGKPADHRSDLFSFGAVMYEMVGGKRPFVGESSIETMNAILKEDPPDLTTTAAHAPPALDRLIRRCLEKSPEERFQSARDLAFALEALSGHSTTQTLAATGLAEPARARKWLAPAAALVLLIAVGWAMFRAGERAGQSGGRNFAFRQVTFRPQAVFRAAFAPDGKTIVYSAAQEGAKPQLFLVRPEYPESVPLGVEDAQLLSISRQGELALLTKASYLAHRLFVGTLARMPLGSGAPREILENVMEADWAPDGSELAIIREVGGKSRLEYPAGKVLYETAGYVSDLRFSPDGTKIAFFEHPIKYDDRGLVAVADLAGRKTDLAGGFWGLEGLAWSRDGREIYFSGSSSGGNYTLQAVSLEGEKREGLPAPGSMTVQDVAADGRWLVTQDNLTTAVVGKGPGAAAERDLSWLDFSITAVISPDGRKLAFSEQGWATGVNYAVCLRGMDGSPVLRLGEGVPMDFSPDGAWVLANIPGTPQTLVLYPTGAGEMRKLEGGKLTAHSWGKWFRDGKRVLVCGSEPGHAERCYVQELAGGPPKPLTPEGTGQGVLSPDGKLVLVRSAEDKFLLYPVEGGGEPRPIPWLTRKDQVVRWSTDGRALLVIDTHELPARVQRVDVASGRRSVIQTLAPSDRSGVLGVSEATVSDDERSYAYGYGRAVSLVFVVEGAK